MRICITGIAGFIGSSLADRLISEGHEVWGIDNLATGKIENVNPSVDFEERDVTHLPQSPQSDLIIHCAASYKLPDAWRADIVDNIIGAETVARAAWQWNCPIFYFQTVLPPISSYAISKIAAEHYLRLSGQPLTVFRLAGIYGPRNLSGAIPTFYRQIMAGEPCTAVEDATRDFVFIEDVVERVVEFFGPRAQPMQHVVDIRTGMETPIRNIPLLIGEMLDIEPTVNLVPRREDDVPHYEMNGTPRVGTSFIDGLRKTVEWYEQNGVGETYTHLKIGK